MFKASTTLLFGLAFGPPELLWLVGMMLAFLAGVLAVFASLRRWLSDEFRRARRR